MTDAPATVLRILAVTDLSPAGDTALAHACERARDLKATLGVVHGIPTIDAIRPLFPQRLADDVVLSSELPILAETALRQRLEALDVGDVPVELFLERGTTAHGAMTVIDRWQPSLVVIGGSMEGTVDADLVRHTHVPILVARTSPKTGRVIACTDFSDPSLPAIRAAAEEVARRQGELVVAHAIDLAPISIYGVDLPMISAMAPGELHEAAQQRLDASLRSLGLTAKTHVCIGPAASSLVDAASSLDAELVVVGTHGRSGVTRFLLGSVAEAIVHRAPCSVLVVRLS